MKTTVSALRRVAAEGQFDLVHGIHAFRAAHLAREVAVHAQIPLVVSFRGPDAVAGLTDPCLRPLVERAVRSASAITTLTEDQAARVRATFPGISATVTVVPHGVELGAPSAEELGRTDPASERAALGVDVGAPLVVHVAGVRSEKGFPEVLALLDAARAALPTLRYVHMGPVLDRGLGDQAARWFGARAWATSLGSVPRARVLSALGAATVSLHASVVEGLSNALLESMAVGTPVVARDVPASRAAVVDEKTGLLFRTDEDAVRAILRVVSDPSFAQSMAAAARADLERRFSPESEAAGYVRAYVAAREHFQRNLGGRYRT